MNGPALFALAALAALAAGSIPCQGFAGEGKPDAAPLPPEVQKAVKHFLLDDIDREIIADHHPDDLEVPQMIFHESIPIGGGGSFSAHVRAFREILESPAADQAFKRLLNEAPPAGQLYALCGLYWTDRKFFQEAVKPFLADKREIYAQIGCIPRRERICDLVGGPDRFRGNIQDGGLPKYFAGKEDRAPGPAPFTWSNPIYFQGKTPKDEIHDPCIIHEGGTYYLVFTVWPFRGRDEKHLGDTDCGSSPGI